MDQAKKIIELESQVKTLKEQVDFINKRFGLVPDEKELKSAVEQIILNRDITKLTDYVRRGGVIPISAKSERKEARA